MIRAGFTVIIGAMFAAGAAGQAQTSAQAPSTSSSSAQIEPGGAQLPSGTAINAELNSSVDTKKAKAGDKVEAHTTEAITFAGKTIVPKGAKLEGHVTESTARSKGDSGSTLAIQFDKAIAKKGEEVPLNVEILAVAAPQNDLANTSSGPVDSMGSTGSPSPGGSAMGGRQPSQASSYPSPAVADSQSNSVVGTNGSAELPADSRGVYGLKDLKLMTASSQAGQTTVITSSGKNVHLDGGTRLLLVAQGTAAPAPAPAPSK